MTNTFEYRFIAKILFINNSASYGSDKDTYRLADTWSQRR